MKVYKCTDCGALVAVSWSSDEPAICRGEHLREVQPKKDDAAAEKHVPLVSVEGQRVRIHVGSVTHPQNFEHNISWVAIRTRLGEQIKYLETSGEPSAEFLLTEGDDVRCAYAFCNQHGLWSKEI